MGSCLLKSHRVHIYSDYENNHDLEDISSKLRGSDKFSKFTFQEKLAGPKILTGNNNDVFLDFDKDLDFPEDSNQKLLRTNLGAIKMLIRNLESREAFRKYLCNCDSMKISRIWKSHLYTSGGAPYGANWSELLVCYQDLEDIKELSDEDQVLSRTTGLVWRYRAMYESVRIASGVSASTKGPTSPATLSFMSSAGTPSPHVNNNLKNGSLANHKIVEFSLWDCMGKLKHIDIMSTPKDLLVNYIVAVETSLLSCLVEHFEGFLKSELYRNWQQSQMRQEKNRRTNSKGSLTGSGHGEDRDKERSERLPTCSGNYPNILIVDDSTLMLKLTGLTLEKDGHNVQKASNGEMALALMSSHQYDIVLLDLNMPVMDGFETVRQFRRLEKERLESVAAAMNSFPSDVSSISEEHSSERDEDSFYRAPSPQPEPSPVRFSPCLEDVRGRKSSDRDSYKDTLSPLAKVAERAVQEAGLGIDLGMDAESPQQQKRKEPTSVPYRQLIIGMSSCADEATRRKALESGMDYFLSKPFSLERFIETIMLSDGLQNDPNLSPTIHCRDFLHPQQSILSSTSATSSLNPSLLYHSPSQLTFAQTGSGSGWGPAANSGAMAGSVSPKAGQVGGATNRFISSRVKAFEKSLWSQR